MQKQTKDKLKKAVPLALGSSMMVLSLIPAAAAFAASNNFISNVQTHVSGKMVSATSNHGHLNVWYQFRITAPNGHTWIQRRFGSSPSMTWVPPGSGTYHVEAFALTQWQVAHKQWNKAVAGTKIADTKAAQVASISISGAPTTNIATNTAETLTVVAKNSAGNVIANPGTPKWTLSSTSGAALQNLANGGTVFDATMAGSYTVTATLDGQTATATIVVYGAPAAVKLTPASSSLVADGAATDAITATIVDANGNTVSDYNGTITVTDNVGDGSTYGLMNASGNFVAPNTPTQYTVTNGVVKFQIGASSTAGQVQTLTSSALTPVASGTNINYGTVSITQTQAAATNIALQVVPTYPSFLGANTQNSTRVQYQLQDASGASLGTFTGHYATITVSGPGSLSSTSSVTSKTVYVEGNVWNWVTVYSEQGQPGTITVSIAATGLTGSSVTIPSYENTGPAALNVVAKGGTDPSTGNAWTQYTVTVNDTNGHPIAGATDSLSITDNAPAQGGSLVYGTVNSQGVFTPSSAPTQLTNGVATFAVETGAVGTSPATITITDTSDPALKSVTEAYNFTAGGASKVAVSPTLAGYYVEPGQTVTYTAQLEDGSGNAVSEAGQSVTFSFTGDTAGATLPDGLTTGTYTATTDTNGVASVTVTVPSTAPTSSSTFGVQAVYNGQPAVSGATISVVSAAAYATQLAVSGAPTVALVAGSSVSSGTITVAVDNIVGTPISGNTLQITTSNSQVLPLPNPDQPGGSVETLSSGAYGLPTLTGGLAGTATITVTDISDPAKPSASFAVNVVPSSSATPQLEYNGHAVSASNPLVLSANTPVALTVLNADAGGNPVPVSGSTPLQVDLFNTGDAGNFEAVAGGAAINDVFIPAGQTSTTVYYESPTATTIDSGMTAQKAVASSLRVTSPSSSAFSATAGSAEPYTFTLLDQNGNALQNSGLTLGYSLSGTVTSGSVTLNGTTGVTSGTVAFNSNGQATVTVTDTKATDSFDVVGAQGSVSGTSVKETVVPGVVSVSQSTFTLAPTSAATSGAAFTATITLEDQYGNVETGISSGTAVFTTTLNSGATLTGAASASVTLTSGVASATFTTGGTPTGTVTVTVNADGITKTATFTE